MRHNRFSYLHSFFVLLCLLSSVLGGRSFSFDFHWPILKSGRSESTIKIFDGSRVRNDSIFMVYHHDLAVAVVELGPEKLLLNCNVIEIYSDHDIKKAMGPLKDKTSPVPITMEEMLHLMDQCAQLDQMNHEDHTPIMETHEEEHKNLSERLEEIKALFNNHSTILSGIVPGTKWCGTGDLAKDYHELGVESLTDICCRNHDLCPVKIRAFSKKYGLRNNSLYTKSHCSCDDMFNSCLKRHATKSADLLGNLYFNFIRVPCLEDGKEGRYIRDSKRF